MSLEEENKSTLNKLVDSGSNVTGAIIASAIASVLPGLEGILIGAVSSEFFIKGIRGIGEDFSKRYISPQEEKRVGTVYICAVKKIIKRWNKGDRPRTDDFFNLPPTVQPACIEIPITERPPSDEVLEGILLAAQREHEEKKLPFLSNLLANIYYDPNIDIPQINFLIKISSTMSFRQMCILSMFSDPYKSKINGRYCAEAAFPKSNENLDSIFQEIIDLGSKGLLYSDDEPVTKASLANNPRYIKVIGAGISLYKLMELEYIDEEYLNAITYNLFPQESERDPPKISPKKRNSQKT